MNIPSYITYVVQPGDTLSGIAAKYGTTCQTLTALNNRTNLTRIYAGQTIRVPEYTASSDFNRTNASYFLIKF